MLAFNQEKLKNEDNRHSVVLDWNCLDVGSFQLSWYMRNLEIIYFRKLVEGFDGRSMDV
jgi:hypothetical protein